MCGISKGTLEIPHKISYPYIESCGFLFTGENLRALRFKSSEVFLKRPRGTWSGRHAQYSVKIVHVLQKKTKKLVPSVKLCGVHSQTNDQHTDLRATTNTGDVRHFRVFYRYISQHSNFDFMGENRDRRLVCLATGLVAPLSANADKAAELGAEEVVRLSGATYVDMMTSSNGNIFRDTGPLCREFTGPGEFPAQRPVTRSLDVSSDLRLNTRLSKQP